MTTISFDIDVNIVYCKNCSYFTSSYEKPMSTRKEITEPANIPLIKENIYKYVFHLLIYF